MFEYYEIVRIVSCAESPEIVGKEGYIAGMSYEDGGPVEGYGVFVFDKEKVYAFVAEEILSLGWFIDPAQASSDK
jgi:hypothetical protein